METFTVRGKDGTVVFDPATGRLRITRNHGRDLRRGLLVGAVRFRPDRDLGLDEIRGVHVTSHRFVVDAPDNIRRNAYKNRPASAKLVRYVFTVKLGRKAETQAHAEALAAAVNYAIQNRQGTPA
jgi:hypothetical protein